MWALYAHDASVCGSCGSDEAYTLLRETDHAIIHKVVICTGGDTWAVRPVASSDAGPLVQQRHNAISSTVMRTYGSDS